MTRYRAMVLIAIGFAVTACSPTKPDPPQGAGEHGVADAELVYREDLRQNPGKPTSR